MKNTSPNFAVINRLNAPTFFSFVWPMTVRDVEKYCRHIPNEDPLLFKEKQILYYKLCQWKILHTTGKTQLSYLEWILTDRA